MTAPAYVSDAKRERDRWMTFPEAVAEVAKRVRRNPDSAEQQVRDALSDCKLVIRWEDRAKARTTGSDGATPIPDTPPKDGDGWRDASDEWHVWGWRTAHFEEDMVFDPFKQRSRRLLVLRFSVHQIWQEQPPAPPAPVKRPRGRPGYAAEKIRQKLTGVDFKTATDALDHVRQTWSQDDGKRPSDDYIRELAREILRKKTEQE